MKISGIKTGSGEVSTTIDLDLDMVPKSKRSEVKKEVGEFLLEKTQESLNDAKSPVSGERFPKLSSSYATEKRGSGLPAKANLEFTGDLRDSLQFKSSRGSQIKLGHFTSSESGKADGHNNFSGDSPLPQRRYLPDTKQKYKRDIQSGVDSIIKDAAISDQEFTKTKFKDVNNSVDFWRTVSNIFPGLSKPDIRDAIKRSPSITRKLEAFGLLRFLGG